MENEPQTSPRDDSEELADPDWFREPSVREHRIAAALFVGFGLFFILLFIVQAGWWFRWVVLGLAVISIIHGLRHFGDSRAPRREN
jgi:fatty acid desaturase